MQDIHIPVKWIAFWRCLRKDLSRVGGGGGVVVGKGGGGGCEWQRIEKKKIWGRSDLFIFMLETVR